MSHIPMSHIPDKIVITGAGLVTGLGLSCQQTWEAILQGRSAIGYMSAIETPLESGKDGGQAMELPEDFAPNLPREARYLKWVVADACANARIAASIPYDRRRCCGLFGTTLHGMRAGGRYLRSGDLGHLREFLAGQTLQLAIDRSWFGGLVATTCSACSSSLGSIALGVTLLQTGQADLVIAGGYDPISEYVYAGFSSLRLVADGPLRPFAKNRQGMKLAEGYGVVVLERAGDAVRRGVKPLATILGWGESADAHHLTQPHPQGDGAARAMSRAMSLAALMPAEIDLIAAHATGTPDNDAGEFAAFSRIFGDHLPRVPVVAFKSHLGHTLGGAGAVELILSALALRDQIVPACANVSSEEVEFPGLNLATGKPQPAGIRRTLNTSLGFGGANTCVILGPGSLSPVPRGEGRGEGRGAPQPQLLDNRNSPERPSPQPSPLYTGERESEVYITGVGVILPGIIGNDAFLARLNATTPPAWQRDSGGVPEEQLQGLLNARRVRRMSDYVKLTLAAATLACRDAGIEDIPAFAQDCAAILGTLHGSVNYSAAYYTQIVKEGLIAANPMLFAESVPNAGAAQLSLMLSLKGACQTVIGTRTAGLDAMSLAASRIRSGAWERAIVGAGDEYSDLVNVAYHHCGLRAAASHDSLSPVLGGEGRGEGPHAKQPHFIKMTYSPEHPSPQPSPPITGEREKYDHPPGAPFLDETGFVTGSGAVIFILESRRSMRQRGGKARAAIRTTAAAFGNPSQAVDSLGYVLEELKHPANVLSSACGTWIDRAEAAAIRRDPGAKRVSTIYGHIAETFSVSPLAGLAAVLIARRLPRLLGDGWDENHAVRGGDGKEPLDSVAVICTDFSGSVSGLSVGII